MAIVSPWYSLGRTNDKRFRILTRMVAEVFVGPVTVLAVQGWRAHRQEPVLRVRLQAIEAEYKFASMKLRV